MDIPPKLDVSARAPQHHWANDLLQLRLSLAGREAGY